MTIERARRFARAYLDEFGPKGRFDMSMPNELELEMVAAVFKKELDCKVEYSRDGNSISVEMPWVQFATLSTVGDDGQVRSSYLS